MLVRVKLIGSGVDGDPFRAPLPNYANVLSLHDQGVIYALIPETEHPELDKHPSAKFEDTGHGPALIELNDAAHNAWYEHLDDRYQEHKHEFRPEIV